MFRYPILFQTAAINIIIFITFIVIAVGSLYLSQICMGQADDSAEKAASTVLNFYIIQTLSEFLVYLFSSPRKTEILFIDLTVKIVRERKPNIYCEEHWFLFIV